jgi:peptidoglycan/LPS O-acetylase OafA/YrhL
MRFRVLDSWRGILALLVALGHFEALWPFVNASLVRNSYLAVDFFFVLSGFVIAHAYGARVREAGSGAGFMLRRFGRLWPLHIGIIGVFFLMQLLWLGLDLSGVKPPEIPFWGGFSLSTLPANFALLQASGLIAGGSWNFPSWSIGVEFWTYLVFALACLSFGERLGRAALPIALVAGLVILLFSDDYMSVYEGIALFRCIYGFFVGVAIHALLCEKGLPRRTFAAHAEIPMLVIGIAFIIIADKTAWTMLAPVVFGGLIYVFAAEAGPLSRLLSTTPFQKIGLWSYSIYMVHAVILFAMKDSVKVIEQMTGLTLSKVARFGGGDRTLIFIHDQWTTCLVVLLFLGLSVAAASLTYRMIEDPGRKFFSRLAARLEARANVPDRRPLRPRLAAGSV